MLELTKRPVLNLFLILLLALALTGCGADPKTGAEQSEIIDTYTIADTTGDWGFPSPYGYYARGPGYLRMSFIFDTLVWKDDQGYVPALAEKWSYDEQTNSYTFHLRRDVTWHDGQPLTTGDVLFTFDYTQKHPQVFSNTENMAVVEDLGDYRIRVVLKEPYAPFLEELAGTMPILPKHIWQDVDQPEQFRSPEALVGSGPYKFEDYNQEHGTYLFSANDQYYGGTPLVQKLRMTRVSKEMTQQSLQRGDVNAAEVAPEVVAGLEQSGFSVMSGPSFLAVWLRTNHAKEPLNNKEFRQALAYAIDRTELVQVVARGHAIEGSTGIIPPDSDWHNPNLEQYPHDLEKARSILAGLGYTLHQGMFQKEGQPLVLSLLVIPPLARDGELLAAQLAKAGIKVEVKSLEMQTFDATVGKGQYDLAVNNQGGLGGDPILFNRLITGDDFKSARYTGNQQLNQIMDQQPGEMNLQARQQLVYQLQELNAADVPAFSLYYPKTYFGHDGRIPLYYTKSGVAMGVPSPLNKMCFVSPAQ